MPEHPDLQDEQEFLDRAYDGLEFMRGEARQMLEGVLDLGRGGTFQSRTERDIVVRTSLARLEQLDIGDQALVSMPDALTLQTATKAQLLITSRIGTITDANKKRLPDVAIDTTMTHTKPPDSTRLQPNTKCTRYTMAMERTWP